MVPVPASQLQRIEKFLPKAEELGLKVACVFFAVVVDVIPNT